MSSVAHPDLADLLAQKNVRRNLSMPKLVEAAVNNGEGVLSSRGALVAQTGKRTGRSPKDKFTVKDAITDNKVAWGSVNLPFMAEEFDALYDRVLEYLGGKQVYVQDLFCGADPRYQLPIQVINELAWHNLFVRQLFIRPTQEELKTHKPEFTIVSAPGFLADPDRDGTNSEVFVIVNFTRRVVIIGGTAVRRRNEEIDLRRDELPVAGTQRVPDALFGQHWRRRRNRTILRTLGNRQNYAFR